MPQPDQKESHPLRICLFGTYSLAQEYSRNLCIKKALEELGHQVIECRGEENLATEKRINAFRSGKSFIFGLKHVLHQWQRLIKQHALLPEYDLMLVPYPSHADIFLAKYLARKNRKPVFMDAFIGLYDTIVNDRELLSPRNPLAFLVKAWEYISLRLADRILIDTNQNADYLSTEYKTPRDRFLPLPVGIDENIWKASPLPPFEGTFRVAFWGTFIPFHGMDVLAYAAKELLTLQPKVQIEIMGDGQTADDFAKLIDELELTNVTWHRDFFPMEEVAALAKRSHCCIGAMNTSGKGGRVIPYKVYQALASGRPLISAESKPLKLLYNSTMAGNLLFSSGDAHSLAERIAKLASNRKDTKMFACQSRKIYEIFLSTHIIKQQLQSHLSRETF